jgi:hypothetical protein
VDIALPPYWGLIPLLKHYRTLFCDYIEKLNSCHRLHMQEQTIQGLILAIDGIHILREATTIETTFTMSSPTQDVQWKPTCGGRFL